MKAIRVNETGDSSVLKLEEIEKPQPGADEILVKVLAVGVNPVDTYIRTGNYGAVDLPYTPGMDASGEVEEVGDDVSRFKAGDRVYASGGKPGAYAEYIVCAQNQAHPLPENITFRQGACINVPYATAYRALFHKAGARPGNKVLIHGASGGVGIAAVQIAFARGMEITGTAGTDEGLELVKKQGAAHVYNHHDEGYLERAVEEATGGKGFDVIIEMLANVNLDHDLDSLARNGRVVVVGNRDRVEIDPRKMMGKDLSILGMTLMSASPEALRSIHAALRTGLENGTLNPIIDKAYPLADATEAHDAVMESGSHGKIILVTD